MINRWVECFWRSRCYLDGLCALPLAILRLANMFRLTSALLLQLWALAAFGQDFFVSANTEYERLQLVWSAVFTAECLNPWLPLNVWQVISEAEDTGGKNPLTCFGVDSGKFGLQWFNVVALFFFCLYRIWVLLRLRHWNPCSRSWHNLWRLDLWATGHYRYIIALRLAGQRIWLDQWNNWFLLLLALCCHCFLSLCDWTPELSLSTFQTSVIQTPVWTAAGVTLVQTGASCVPVLNRIRGKSVRQVRRLQYIQDQEHVVLTHLEEWPEVLIVPSKA